MKRLLPKCNVLYAHKGHLNLIRCINIKSRVKSKLNQEAYLCSFHLHICILPGITHTKKKPVERGCVLTEIKDHGRFKGSRVRKARPIKRKFNGIRFTQAKALKVDNDVTGMSTSGNGEKNVEEKEEEDEAKSASLLKLSENVGTDLETCQESTPENHCIMDSKRYLQTVQKLKTTVLWIVNGTYRLSRNCKSLLVYRS